MSNESASCCGPSCCGGEKSAAAAITSVVREKYGAMATSNLSNSHDGVKAIAEAFGYSEAELTSIPADANLGLSCGNPTATANLRPGEVVVDLGSGGGLDVFLAAKKVGPTGKAIGIDMTPEMIKRARRSAADDSNVEFYLSTIDKVPLPDGIADVVISNCVINLAPDKQAVFEEIFRLLKPGGRLAISDIVLKKALPNELAQSVSAWFGCVAGAISVDEYVEGLKNAGLGNVVAIDEKADLNAYANVEGQAACCTPVTTSTTLPIAGAGCCTLSETSSETSSVHNDLANLLEKFDINDFAASVKVYATKAM